MKLLPFLIPLFLFAGFSHAEVYKWIDLNGKIQFSDKKPERIKAEELKLKVNTYTNVTFDDSVFDVGPKVVMYSTNWCHYCKKARQYFNKNNIAYTEYDIDKNKKAKRRYKKMGATGVPVILVGKKRMNGFNKKGFERIYR
jgi:glutaredoxin